MKKILGLLVFLSLTACAASDKLKENASVEELYNKAFDDLEKTKYKKAAEEFEQVEIEHPYSQWAVKAKLMGAYAYYKNEDYDDAVLALDRFIKYHPGNKDAAYAYYLKGMCYYDQISTADKDQADTEKAEEAFNRLIMLYPNSEYAADARQKVNLAEDYKAGQEMIIGRYYLNNGNYLSALNRFNVVLENYQTTVQIEEALYRQVEIYGILGLNKYAAGYFKILKNNYPDGVWTQRAAKVMEKISKTSVKKTKTSKQAAEVKEETSSSWFGWFKSDEKPEVKAEAPKKEVEEVKEETSSGWFGWFKSDEKPEVKAETPKKEVEEVKEETSSSWFSWFKSGEQPDVAVEEIAVEVEDEQPKIETAETTEKEPLNSVKVSQKTRVGDIISSSPKGKK